MSHYDEIIRRVYASDLTPKTQLAALGLLGAAVGGVLVCTKERAGQLCGTKSWGATRRMLGKIQAGRLIHYRTNEYVYVMFSAYYVDDSGDQPRAESDQPRAESDHETSPDNTEINNETNGDGEKRAPVIEKRADVITFRSATRAFEPGVSRLGWVGNDLNTDPDQINLPNPPATETVNLDALKPDQAWTYQMLTDPEIGVLAEKALAVVKWHTAAYAVRHVASWWVERETVGVGALVWRLMNPARSRPGPANADFLASALYRRHYPLTPAQARARSYSADPPPVEPWIAQLPMPVFEAQS